MTWIWGIHYTTEYTLYEKHPMMCFFLFFQRCLILSSSILRPTVLISVCTFYFESHGTLGFPFWMDKEWWDELKEQEGRGALCPILFTHEIQKWTLTFISINKDISENQFYSSKWSHSFFFHLCLIYSCHGILASLTPQTPRLILAINI